jgi:hypothetical protein
MLALAIQNQNEELLQQLVKILIQCYTSNRNPSQIRINPLEDEWYDISILYFIYNSEIWQSLDLKETFKHLLLAASANNEKICLHYPKSKTLNV